MQDYQMKNLLLRHAVPENSNTYACEPPPSHFISSTVGRKPISSAVKKVFFWPGL